MRAPRALPGGRLDAQELATLFRPGPLGELPRRAAVASTPRVGDAFSGGEGIQSSRRSDLPSRAVRHASGWSSLRTGHVGVDPERAITTMVDSRSDPRTMIETDVLIVGSGPAGSSAAALLST